MDTNKKKEDIWHCIEIQNDAVIIQMTKTISLPQQYIYASTTVTWDAVRKAVNCSSLLALSLQSARASQN